MRRSLAFGVLLLITLLAACGQHQQTVDSVQKAFEAKEANVQVEGEGTVLRVLADDRSGTPHQRIVLSLASGQTILIQHNIDVAKRIDDLKVGDIISFNGEYIWNDQGGLVHWTHHDPANRHPAGWLKHDGRTYQ